MCCISWSSSLHPLSFFNPLGTITGKEVGKYMKCCLLLYGFIKSVPSLSDSSSNICQYLHSTFLWCPTHPLLFLSRLCMCCIFNVEIWQSFSKPNNQNVMKQKVFICVSHLDGVENAKCLCLLSRYYFAVTPAIQLVLLPTSFSGSSTLTLMAFVPLLRQFHILPG